MGCSGMILKKVDLFTPKETLSEIKKIMDSLGFNYTIDAETGDFHIGINDPECNSDFCMFIFDKPEPEYMDDEFAWISPEIYAAVLIEDITDSEESILKILHKYLYIHPSEVFYAEEDWFYTKEDIDLIYEKGDRKYWCYRRPL